MTRGVAAMRSLARRLSAICVASVLFSLPVFSISAQNPTPSDMKCCHGKRSCCCRKGAVVKDSTTGPAWSARPNCFNHCAQTPGVAPSAAVLSFSPARTLAVLLPAGEAHPPLALWAGSYESYAYLHQRPPPSSSLA